MNHLYCLKNRFNIRILLFLFEGVFRVPLLNGVDALPYSNSKYKWKEGLKKSNDVEFSNPDLGQIRAGGFSGPAGDKYHLL